MCSTWDHCPVYAVVQDGNEEEWCAVEEEKWTEWRPCNDEQNQNSKDFLMQRGDEEQVKSLSTNQKSIETATERLHTHSTKKRRNAIGKGCR